MKNALTKSGLDLVVVDDVLGSFYEFDDTEKGKPPFLGEHNMLILREVLGLSEEEVERLFEEGVISSASY